MIGTVRGTTRQRKEVAGLPASVAVFTPTSTKCLSLKVAVNAVQQGSGTPSPVNVMPIVGVSEVNLSNTTYLNESSTITNAYIDNNGNLQNSSAYRCTAYIEIPSGVNS